MCFFFFFKQKTAYEIKECDWSSDVCSSDLDYFSHLPFETYIEQLEQLGGGLSALRKFYPGLTIEYQQKLTQLTQEAYGGRSACESLYGFHPKYLLTEGTWRTEIALVDPVHLASISHFSGIVTGRTEQELRLGMKTLHWSLTDKVIAWSDDPALDKPNPSKLIGVIQNLKTHQPVYLGDTRDDAELVKNYRCETGRGMDFCLIGNSDSQIEYDLSYASVSDFFNNEEINYD